MVVTKDYLFPLVLHALPPESRETDRFVVLSCLHPGMHGPIKRALYFKCNIRLSASCKANYSGVGGEVGWGGMGWGVGGVGVGGSREM